MITLELEHGTSSQYLGVIHTEWLDILMNFERFKSLDFILLTCLAELGE